MLYEIEAIFFWLNWLSANALNMLSNYQVCKGLDNEPSTMECCSISRVC